MNLTTANNLSTKPIASQPRRILHHAALLLVLVGLNANVLAEEPTVPTSPAVPAGQWLFDHAAIFSLGLDNPTIADAEYVLIWLDAAIAVSPEIAQAYRQKAELLLVLDRTDEATQALETYCKLAPNDLNAAFRLTDLQLDRAQTAEARIALCNAMLTKDEHSPAEITSDLHRRLAELHAGRGETSTAQTHAREAILRYPGNLTARTLLAKLEGKLDDPVTQIELLLANVSANPARTIALLDVARALESYGACDEASTWYDAVIASLDRTGDDESAFDVETEQAWCQLDNDHHEQCFKTCTRLLEAHPGDTAVEMLLIRAAREMGHTEIAERHTTALATRLIEKETHTAEKNDSDTPLRLAEFYLDISPDPKKALNFAQRAAMYVPDIAQPLVGRALVAAKEFKEAILPLTPLATTDQRSALALARAQISLGDLDAAKKTLRTAEKLRFTGQTYHAIVELLGEMNEEPAARPDLPAIQTALDKFDRRVLDFPANAGNLVKFDVTLDGASYTFTQPIHAKLTLENKAPYPIQLGVDRMIDARASTSLADTARYGPKLSDYLEIPLDRKLLLKPGERIEVAQRIDTAVARMVLAHQPQRRRLFELTFVLDPDPVSDKPVSTLAKLAPITRRFTRLPVDASGRGIKRLAHQIASGDESERFTAIEVTLALIHERLEALEDSPHTYAAATVDPAKLSRLILTALQDPAPAVRARALWALAYIRLDDSAIAAAAPLINDPDWLPRLLAIEMFAKHQGSVFLPVLKAKSDDDNPLVARLASLYIEQATAAQDQTKPNTP